MSLIYFKKHVSMHKLANMYKSFEKKPKELFG